MGGSRRAREGEDEMGVWLKKKEKIVGRTGGADSGWDLQEQQSQPHRRTDPPREVLLLRLPQHW